MPPRPARPCRQPGCPSLIRSGSYCERHQKEARKLEDRDRGNATQRGYDYHWQKVRAAYRKAHPVCEYCGNRPTAEVHHLVKVRDGGSNKWENLKAACHSCHKRYEGKGVGGS